MHPGVCSDECRCWVIPAIPVIPTRPVRPKSGRKRSFAWPAARREAVAEADEVLYPQLAHVAERHRRAGWDSHSRLRILFDAISGEDVFKP